MRGTRTQKWKRYEHIRRPYGLALSDATVAVMVGDAPILPASGVSKAADSDLEFQHSDDSWYSVRADLRGDALNIKYLDFHDSSDENFRVGDFKSLDDIKRFKRRFRPVSRQLQDNECSKVTRGMLVCASHVTNSDLRYFDATVEEVKFKEHRRLNGEEECLCTFLIEWRHGPNKGALTDYGIGNICLVQSTEQNDPMVASFLALAMGNIPSSRQMLQTFDESISSHWESLKQDMDLGGEDTSTQHLMVVGNLEKGLPSKVIVDFIKDKTSIETKAFISPSLSSESYTRGIILVDRRENLEKLYKFVENPNHIIISWTGRPWVITERLSGPGFLRMSFGNLKQDFQILQEKLTTEDVRNGKRLKVAFLGTHEYRKAKQLRELFKEFVDHQLRLHKTLALEERKIMQACHGGA